MQASTQQHRANAGFTLVELAIVLVIIGLIIGGVLVGQDMIKGAEVRATAGQFEKYSSAVNTFKDKYLSIPGDMTTTQATQFGVNNPGATFRAGATGQSDGNGLLEDCASGARGIGCETALFWNDLSWASLIDGSFNAVTAGTSQPAIAATAIPTYIPVGRMGRGNYISVYADGGYNFFQVGGWGTQTATNSIINPTITPQEAFNMDTKLDDGRPNTGATQARATFTTAAATGSVVDQPVTGTTCATGATNTDTYQTLTTAAAGTPACSLRVRFN